jgi:hypothetical protein
MPQHFNVHEELRGRLDIITSIEVRKQAHRTKEWVVVGNFLGNKKAPIKK